jgi:hypothetical protein
VQTKIVTKFAPISLEVKVKTLSPMKLHLKVTDSSDKTRVFTNRYNTVKGEETFVVRMPLSPETATVSVFSEKTGRNASEDAEKKHFEIVSVKKIPLERRLDLSDIGNARLRSFVAFAQKFAFNLGSLTPQVYSSDDDNYFIKLSPTIKGRDGRILNTPARIGSKSGVIEVSKEKFEVMTIPMMIAILMHEFSHFYLNDKMSDETEADLNGLLIYLGLGYPRIEAYQAFLETFKGTPSQLNKNRYDVINKFINDFEKMNMVIK